MKFASTNLESYSRLVLYCSKILAVYQVPTLCKIIEKNIALCEARSTFRVWNSKVNSCFKLLSVVTKFQLCIYTILRVIAFFKKTQRSIWAKGLRVFTIDLTGRKKERQSNA